MVKKRLTYASRENVKEIPSLIKEKSEMALKALSEKISTPPILAEKDQFLIKIAENRQEIEQALRLRYKVFSVEQGKELNGSGIDCDEYDDYCLHLIVVKKDDNLVVGTYRIHPGEIAVAAVGFYSAREFNIQGMDDIVNKTLEVGRSCVSPEYRNGTVVALLWNGIGAVMRRAGLRYLFGCVSLETVNPATGWALYEYFKENNKLSDHVHASAIGDFALEHPGQEAVNAVLSERRALIRQIPPLFKGYLRLGVDICDEPALDREFHSIDFLILLDLARVPEKYMAHFYYGDS